MTACSKDQDKNFGTPVCKQHHIPGKAHTVLDNRNINCKVLKTSQELQSGHGDKQ